MSNGLFRLRVQFQKTDRLRYLSHLELIHALERMVRRAQLPYAITQGFHPHMKIAFGPALPVGCGGYGEYLDVWITKFIDPAEALDQLARVSVPALSPFKTGYVPEKERSLAALLVKSSYEATCVPEEGQSSFAEDLRSVFASQLEIGTLTVPGKKKDKTHDLHEVFFAKPQVVLAEGEQPEALSAAFTVRFGIESSNEGTLRPDGYLTIAQQQFEEAYGYSFKVTQLMRSSLECADTEDPTAFTPL